jgi:DNA-binding NtrC family response regulator
VKEAFHCIYFAEKGRDAESVAQLTALLPIYMYRASTLEELVLLLDLIKTRLVLTDLENPNGSWRDVLRMLEQRYPGVALIVAAEIRDAASWEEVVLAGGFDVVLKPFAQRELVSVLAEAHRFTKLLSPAVTAARQEALMTAIRQEALMTSMRNDRRCGSAQ